MRTLSPDPKDQDFLVYRANSTRIMNKKIKRFKKNVSPIISAYTIMIYSSILKPASIWARKTFEFKNIQRLFGAIVVLSTFAIANYSDSISSLQTAIETNYSRVEFDSPEIITERSIRLPVDSFTITQGYNLFHPGLDLAAVKGSPVYPVMDGVVEKVGTEKFAFGNHVIVSHGSGLMTIYAHLSKIEVKEGETITKDSIVGLIGSTGWSTGPHLHLQVWEQDHWANPRTFFEGYFGQRLASTK